MSRARLIRAGILFVVAAAASTCGENSVTVPNPKSGIVAVPASEQFLNSAQQESRELLIDGRVVAAGNLRYRTHNNGVPLIIGAGYRHNTHPIEYPFIGEMDCVRITSLP